MVHLKFFFLFVLQGIKARVYETFVVLLLLGVLVFSLVWVVYGIFFWNDDSGNKITFGMFFAFKINNTLLVKMNKSVGVHLDACMLEDRSINSKTLNTAWKL